MVRSCSAGSPRTINPPTAPQPKPSTETRIPVRPKIRNCIDVPPSDGVDDAPDYATEYVRPTPRQSPDQPAASPREPTGRREAPPDDRLRDMRGSEKT